MSQSCRWTGYSPSPDSLQTSGFFEFFKSHLHFNAIASGLEKVPISTTTGLATGPFETILITDAASFILLRDERGLAMDVFALDGCLAGGRCYQLPVKDRGTKSNGHQYPNES